jgi:hypothetical protein
MPDFAKAPCQDTAPKQSNASPQSPSASPPNLPPNDTLPERSSLFPTNNNPSSAVYVKDICAVVSHLIKLLPDAPPHHTYNLGGPERLSRLDMARAVARHCGFGEKAIEAVKSSAMGDRRAQAATGLRGCFWGLLAPADRVGARVGHVNERAAKHRAPCPLLTLRG